MGIIQETLLTPQNYRMSVLHELISKVLRQRPGTKPIYLGQKMRKSSMFVRYCLMPVFVELI